MTGCAGYLGTTLCKQLLSEGHEVTGFDVLLYGKKPLASLMKNSHFTFVKGDIRNVNELARNISDKDAVVHLASIVGAEASKLSAENAVIINDISTGNVAQLCKVYNVRRLVFASTASVYGSYGRLHDGLADERTELRPIEIYGETKVNSERTIRGAFDDFTILRFGTLFGMSDRMRFDLVVNLFTARAYAGEDLIVYGGQQQRPLLHVADAARAISFVLSKELIGTYNVAYDNYVISEIAKQVRKIIPCNITENESVTDPRDYRVSCEKIRKAGFNIKYSLEYGIKEIKRAFDTGIVKNYRNAIYSNHAKLFTDKRTQAKVYTQGAIPK
ncbi:MAG: NAD-dependent epimerase/dehydratase family protein [Nitrososphaerales archaeon]